MPEAGQHTRNATPESTPARKGRWFGLSARLLVLTILFGMLAEVLIYVPSIAHFRRIWLKDRLAAAHVAAMVIQTMPGRQLPEGFRWRLLEEAGVVAVTVTVNGERRLLGPTQMPTDLTVVNLLHASWSELIYCAFEDLFSRHNEHILVIGPAVSEAEQVEAVVDIRPLRRAMAGFSRNLILISAAISGITAALVYLSLHLLIVRPVRRLAVNMTDFEKDPEDASRIISPSPRSDEIGLAEQALARMQTTLTRELREKKHLAELGLAVSKVNHDLRNMLASAQLFTDRLSAVSDPTTQRFVPKLIATLGRAIAFCEATLAYGRATEPVPERAMVELQPLVADAAELAGLPAARAIAFTTDIPRGTPVDADAGQLLRVLTNLMRNSMQALLQAGTAEDEPRLTVAARRQGPVTTIRVIDNGPGIPATLRANLFRAFNRSTRPGGTGLGLAIAAELVGLHGGTIVLEDTATGAAFRIEIPDRPPSRGNGSKGNGNKGQGSGGEESKGEGSP